MSGNNILAELPILVSLWSAFDRAAFPPESFDSVVLGGTVANVEEFPPLSWPGSAVTKLPNHATVVAVIDCCMVSENM